MLRMWWLDVEAVWRGNTLNIIYLDIYFIYFPFLLEARYSEWWIWEMINEEKENRFDCKVAESFLTKINDLVVKSFYKMDMVVF